MIFLIMTLMVVVSSVSLNWWFGGQNIKNIKAKAELQSGVYASNYALSAARSYTEAALDYSVYQAVYDTLKEGILSLDEAREKLSSSIKDNMHVYTKNNYRFLSEYVVTLPEYGIEVEAGKKLKVRAVPDSNFEITRKQEGMGTVHIEKRAGIEKTYQINIEGLLSKAAKVRNQAKGALSSILESESRKAEVKKEFEGCGNADEVRAKCEGEKPKTMSIEEIIESVKGSLDGSGYGVEVEKGDGSVEVRTEAECSKGKTVCTYSYVAGVNIRVSVKDVSGIYPVFDGESVSLENLGVEFAVEEKRGT